jgi:hypothetical protein
LVPMEMISGFIVGSVQDLGFQYALAAGAAAGVTTQALCATVVILIHRQLLTV